MTTDVKIESPSDQPFAGLDEVGVDATATITTPKHGRHGWLYYLNYSTFREFLPRAPLPGVGFYFWDYNRSLAGVLGWPKTNLRWNGPGHLWYVASYAFPRTVRAEITLPGMFNELYAGFHWDSRSFLRHDRADVDDQLRYYEKRMVAGWRGFIGGNETMLIYFDIAGGYAFDRFWFEGEDYGDRGHDRLDLGDGAFIHAQISIGLDPIWKRKR